MTRPFSAEERSRLLTAFDKSGLTQEQFCAGLRPGGIGLSPRTLRAWLRESRQDPDGMDVADVRQALAHLKAALGGLANAVAEVDARVNERSLVSASSGLDVAADDEPGPDTAAASSPQSAAAVELPPSAGSQVPAAAAAATGASLPLQAIPAAGLPIEAVDAVVRQPAAVPKRRTVQKFDFEIGDLVDVEVP